MRKTTYELGERFPSGVAFCFAAASLSTTGALGDVVREVADVDLRSAEAGVCVEGARVGKLEWGLEPGSDGGGASGAATDATAVDMAKIEMILQRQQVAIRILSNTMEKRKRQDWRLKDRLTVDRATLGGKGKECGEGRQED